MHGAARDTVEYAASVAGVELASAIDNPCVTLDGRVESNGNFHGAPLAYVLDFLAIPTADVASISERRTDRFLDVARNRGLPAFLAGDPGVDSGFMIAQYTAAGIVSEMKRNAVPASVDSIPSSAMRKITCRWAGPPPASCAGRIPAFAARAGRGTAVLLPLLRLPQAVPSGCGRCRRLPRGAQVRQRNRSRRA